jgi:hypothetical protein
VSAATDRTNAALPRVLPLAVGVLAVAAGYFWLVQPGIADYRRIRAEAQTLDARVRVLEDTIVRGQKTAGPDGPQALELFEQRVSKEDRVTEVVERLTRAVTESAIDGKLGNLAIDSGDQAAPGTSGEARPAEAGEFETVDPRWNLFPYSLTHTTVRLSFDASYGTIAGFFSKIRDLPTTIEIRSVKLTRGLPLMSVELTVFVFRRGDLLPDVRAAVPFQPAPGAPRLSGPEGLPANPLVPRTIEPRGPGG